MLVSLALAIPQAIIAQATLNATENQGRNLEQQQLTERFSKAVEQLGTRDTLELRLGGIYALERIARNSPDEDQPAVINVLLAFVRDKTKRDAQGRCPDQPPAVDVQAALTVLAHRNPRDSDPRINLGNACLARVDLKRGYLRYASFRGADLRGANLMGANLETTSFDNADLRGAYFQGGDYADIAGDARFALGRTNLTAAAFRRADLTGAYLGNANLRNAFLTGANLTGADFTGANLTVANFRGANLTGARLKGADLQSADFTDANLTGNNLTCRVELNERGEPDRLSCR